MNCIWRVALMLALLPGFTWVGQSAAQTEQGFSLQVSPSPLIATVKPGEDTVLELRIRNTNVTSQALKMGIKSFSTDDATGQIKLGQDNPVSVRDIVSFDQPTFTLKAGEIYTQRIHIRAPEDSGFSYNFAVTIAQQNAPKPKKGQSAIAGSVAVFTLINVDRPGAVRKFEVSSVSVTKRTYEYLPASIQLKLKNTGNTDVQPTGSVFIQRKSSDTTPLAVLPLNKDGGYIIPGSSRTFTIDWADGFPHYEAGSNTDKNEQKLVWKGGLGNVRFGKYVAKIVAVYDDGERDVPYMSEVSFWVIPWRILLVVLGVLAVLIIGLLVTFRSFGKAVGVTATRIRR
ncbi:hypothetical protein JNM87_04950, partial [Candidatus Saccharibacteria bacterium]|nr:hypothetical protein [Candidatus Saccharibacteria bacterium]